MAETKSQALVVARDEQPITGEIVNAAEFSARTQQLAARANLITPVIQVSSIAPHHAINLSVVQVDPTVDENGNGPMVYRDRQFMKENERGLNKISLDMIAAAAGISWLPEPYSRRTDDGKKRNYWSFTIVGAYTAMDGTVQTLPSGSAEADLTDGSEQIGGWSEEAWAALLERNRKNNGQEKSINGWTDKRVRQARRFGLALAETKARLRVIRALGIRQKYSVDDLRKPFVVPRVSYIPDLTNPITNRIYNEQKAAGISALFARQAQLPAPASVVSDVTSAMAAGEPAPADPFTPASVPPKEIPFDDLPDDGDDDSSLISVDHVGKSEDTDDYFIYTVDGRKLHTSDKDVARACNVARKNKVPLPVDLNGNEILEIVARTTEKL